MDSGRMKLCVKKHMLEMTESCKQITYTVEDLIMDKILQIARV